MGVAKTKPSPASRVKALLVSPLLKASFQRYKTTKPPAVAEGFVFRNDTATLPPTAGYPTGQNGSFPFEKAGSTGLPAVILSGGWPKQIKPRFTSAFLSPLRAGKQACLPSRQQKSPLWLRQRGLICFVGRTGFEPATPWSQTRYSTGLNYLPNTLYSLKISVLNHPSRRKAAK